MKSNRELAAERASGETVLDALARRQGVERAPATPAQAEVTPPSSAPSTRPSGATALPSHREVERKLFALSVAGLNALGTFLGFFEKSNFSNDARMEATNVLRDLGTPTGCYVDLALRAMIADVAGWREPPFPGWAQVGAYCQREYETLLGAPPRLIVAIEGTEAVLNGGERVPAGHLRQGWKPVEIPHDQFVQLSDLSACVPAPILEGEAAQAMLDQAAAAIDAYLKTKLKGAPFQP